MKIKTVLGLVLCVLLTASVSHAASSSVTVTATSLTVSGTGDQFWQSSTGAPGSPALTGTSAVTSVYPDNNGGLGNSDTQTETDTWVTSVPQTWGSPSYQKTFTVNLSVAQILEVVNSGDWASTEYSVTLNLYESMDSDGGWALVDSDTTGVLGQGISDGMDNIDETSAIEPSLSVATVSGAGNYAKVELIIYTYAAAYGENPETDPGTTEPNPSPIPAPGAVLLSSLGAGLVGWMRRRKTL